MQTESASSPARPSAVALALAQLQHGGDLTELMAEVAVAEMVSGAAVLEQVAELLLALRAKGEAETEIAGGARALRSAMHRIPHPEPEILVDTCGTGGGAVTTVNLSTAAAFVAAGAGVRIAKHGNRSFTSRSGSADVLEALGISLELDAAQAQWVLDEAGLVFLFAPIFHPAMRRVAPVRKQLGVATLMNLLGPLANPAGALRQVVGVGDPARGPAMAGALARLGAVHALVVHASVGMDEFAPLGTTAIWEVRSGRVREWQFDAGGTPIAAPSLAGLEGGEPSENAARMVALLERPRESPAALRGAVLLNAAAAIYVAGLAPTLREAIDVAIDSLDSGRAAERLALLRRVAGLAGGG
jgi:anthranilate phosphoribosyltransferase